MRRSVLLLLALLLAACGRDPLRIAVPPLAAQDSIAVGFASVEVLEVSLPDYADGDDIFVQGQGGALSASAGVSWADDPSRALTLELTRLLNDLTGATIAPSPWPFDDRPEARLDVRVEQFAPDLTLGAFVLRGQYFVGAFDGTGRNRARTFAITTALPPEPGPAAIAYARSQATVALARQIATEGLR
jgi:uncharacterized lipoprotein YmbA